mgnify:CR=1 FL=1
MKLKTLSLLAISLLATACAPMHVTQKGAQATTQSNVEDLAREALSRAPINAAHELDIPYVPFISVKREDFRPDGDVTLSAAQTPFGALMSQLSKSKGYSLIFGENVNAGAKVSAEFNQAHFKDVARQLALMAGYVAVFNERERTITVVETATHTYKLPASMLQPLNANFTVGGNPVAGAGGGSGGGGSSLQAQFTVQGRESNGYQQFEKQLKEIAGKNAQVTVADSGIVTVRSNAQALRRVNDFLRNQTDQAMAQVDIEATVVEVTLTKEMAFGIQWNQILSNGARGAQIGGGLANGALDAATGAITPVDFAGQLAGELGNSIGVYRVGSSSSTIVNALARYTDVKVVSQPRLTAQNNTSSTFFSGLQRPYLGQVNSTAASVQGANPTVSGTLSYAIDGISLSVVPSVLDDKTVSVTLIPVLSTVEKLENFPLGRDGTQLSGAVQSSRTAFNKVTVESGKTLILGGLRYSKDGRDTSVLQNTGSLGDTKELVILLRASVLPSLKYEPLIGESL